MGKGGNGTTPAGRIAGDFASQMSRIAGPARKQVFGQLSEALRTGNVAAKVPLIQSQVEQSLHTGSENQRSLDEQIAKAPGVGRSSYGEGVRAEQSAMSQRATAAIPASVIGQTIMGGPAAVNQAASSAMGQLGAASGAQGTAMQAAAQNNAQAEQEAAAGAAAVIGIAAAI